jgi:hypothetical protein
MKSFEYIGKVQIDDSSFYRYDWKEKDKQISVIIGESKVTFYLIEDIKENKEVFKTKNRDNFLTIHYHYPEKSHREIKKLMPVLSSYIKLILKYINFKKKIVELFNKEGKVLLRISFLFQVLTLVDCLYGFLSKKAVKFEFSKIWLESLKGKVEIVNNEKENLEELLSIKKQALEQFIWKLFSRNEFGESRKVDMLKETILKDKLLSGIKYKYFYSKLKPLKKKLEGKKGTVYNNSKISIVNDSISDYWNFLLEDSNEIVIRPQYHGWFKSREKEILDVVESANKVDIENEKELESLTIKLLLRRQNAIAALGILFPLYTTQFVFSFLIVSFVGIFIGTQLNYNYYIPLTILIVIIVSFVIFNIKKGINDFFRKVRALIPDVFIPRLIIAIISGWILFSTDGDSFKGIFSQKIWIVVAFLAFMLVFLYKESRKIANSESLISLAVRASLVLFYGYVLSCLFGIGVSLNPKSNIEMSNPAFLSISFWILFISFFLQLLIQDKTPTESL